MTASATSQPPAGAHLLARLAHAFHRQQALIAGYDVSTAFSEDGRRQAVLMINQDASTVAKNARPLYYGLIDKAYCSTK